MSSISASVGRAALVASEARKLPAFVRRDFLLAWSYRVSFVTDIAGLVASTFIFYFVGRMVDPGKVPSIAGTRVTYLEFAAIGMALGGLMHLGLNRVSAALRGEQLMGTLEPVLSTRTAPTTIQLGSVLFDTIFIPLRMAILLAALALTFGLDVRPAGIPKAMLVLAAFIPFVWGLGVAAAAVTLTVRRGAGIIALFTVALTLGSGTYFPVQLLPHWISRSEGGNPVALAIDGMRDALLADAPWGTVAPKAAILAPMAVVALALGTLAFRLALRRERRLGTVGIY
jgi:ABC-2 type transport system permease protein